MRISTRPARSNVAIAGRPAISSAFSGRPSPRSQSAISGRCSSDPVIRAWARSSDRASRPVPGSVGGQPHRLAYHGQSCRPVARCHRVLVGGLGVVVRQPAGHHQPPGHLVPRRRRQRLQLGPDRAVELATCDVLGNRRSRPAPRPVASLRRSVTSFAIPATRRRAGAGPVPATRPVVVPAGPVTATRPVVPRARSDPPETAPRPPRDAPGDRGRSPLEAGRRRASAPPVRRHVAARRTRARRGRSPPRGRRRPGGPSPPRGRSSSRRRRSPLRGRSSLRFDPPERAPPPPRDAPGDRGRSPLRGRSPSVRGRSPLRGRPSLRSTRRHETHPDRLLDVAARTPVPVPGALLSHRPSAGSRQKQERPPEGGLSRKNVRRRPTLPPRHQGSTIGAEGLSFRVRNGTGRFPFAMAAETLWS